ncbi:MAG TPA: heme ABC exporter ATP-binding protein CcmA [Ktedonobacterales bacterium]
MGQGGAGPEAIVDRLGKTYEWKPVLRGVSFTLQAGKTLALLGPNGAGKTTLLRILATLARPSRGAVSLAGLDVVRDAHTIRSLIGYVGHAPLFYEELSAEENLLFFARMYGLRDGPRRAAELLARVGLRTKAREQARTLSRGQMQRLSLARALLHTPRVLLLDEPDAGLDDAGLATLYDILGEWRAAGRTLILATHAHERGLSLADEVLVLVGGRVAHIGPAAALTIESVRNIYQIAIHSRGGPA